MISDSQQVCNKGLSVRAFHQNLSSTIVAKDTQNKEKVFLPQKNTFLSTSFSFCNLSCQLSIFLHNSFLHFLISYLPITHCGLSKVLQIHHICHNNDLMCRPLIATNYFCNPMPKKANSKRGCWANMLFEITRHDIKSSSLGRCSNRENAFGNFILLSYLSCLFVVSGAFL